MPKANKDPLPRPIWGMILGATGLFFTPMIWLVGWPMEAALVWAFIFFDVILASSIWLFRGRKRHQSVERASSQAVDKPEVNKESKQ